jgi:hypothetical protein
MTDNARGMNNVTILQGHVLDRLRELPEGSVHLFLTR